jgi:hypothetical protein
MLYHVFYGVIQIIGAQLAVNQLQVSFKKIRYRTFVTKNKKKLLELKCGARRQLLDAIIKDYVKTAAFVFLVHLISNLFRVLVVVLSKSTQ